MYQSGAFAERYALARRTLVQAAITLRERWTQGFTLVGAHAVYLHTPRETSTIPTFTFDGDLAVDPTWVRRSADIRSQLNTAGFDLRGRESGLYVRRGVPESAENAARVDVLVPASVEYVWEADGYDARATMSQPGLEVCLHDHAPMTISTLEDGGPPLSVEIAVAGVVGLLVAKAWKLGERAEQGAEAFQEVYKDVADVYRLLRVSERDKTVATVREIAGKRGLPDCIRTGATYLREISTNAALGETAMRALLGNGRAARVEMLSFTVLAAEFSEDIATALGPE